MQKEIVINFEQEKPIKLKLVDDQAGYNLSNVVRVVKGTLTNEDETLILTVDGENTNINTNIIQRYENNYSFPNRGKENVLYIDMKHHKIYYWLNGGYQLLSEYEEPTIIYGGDANGGKNINYPNTIKK